MDEAKKKKLEEMLQSLIERELNQEKEKPATPPRTTGGSGGVIRRRKGQPDRRLP